MQSRKKRGVIFFKKKYAIVFASTQLRITRLRKYPIDPKAYLGRWVITLSINFSDTQGQLTTKSVMESCRNSNSSKL